MPTRPKIPFLLDLLRLAMRKEASALYVVPWMPPTLRIDERSVPLSSVAFTPEQSTLLVLDVLDEVQRAALDRSREIQFSFTLDDVGQFRVHAFRRHGQPAMAIRPYITQVPTPRVLALPALACNAALADRGLLLLASRSPSLRRSVAAALLEHRNRSGVGELAILDDATRYWHEAARCQVRQGLSAAALDDLLRRRQGRRPAAAGSTSPLAVAWGDLRDGPQLERVMQFADQALCLVSVDADNVLHALQRLIRLSAEHTGSSLLHRTALHLHGVLALRAVPAASGGPDLAATDALMNSPELAANLAEGDLEALRVLTHGPGVPVPLGATVATGADEHLWQLFAQGLVRQDDALRHAMDREAFAQRAAAAVPRPEPDAATAPVTVDPGVSTAPVTVDTGFADLFDTTSRAADAFEFAEAPPAARAPDTQFDSVEWPAAAPNTRSADPSAQPVPNAPRPDSVQFHAWTAAYGVAGRNLPIDLWAALPAQDTEVLTQAPLAGPWTPPSPLTPRDRSDIDGEPSTLTLHLHIDGLPGASATRQLLWQGRPTRVRFDVPLPGQTSGGVRAARVRITVGGLPVGELSFVLNVLPAGASAATLDGGLEDTQAARRMLQSAYAAYASSDRGEVHASVKALQRVAPGLDVFIDAPQLRSSEQWRDRIEREAGRRERLFLFWSCAAAESPWVDFEWRLMMRRRGAGMIDVVMIDPPRLAPLPPELSDLLSADVLIGRRVQASSAHPAPG
jgi:Tfp pilus assembly ATPase PilU